MFDERLLYADVVLVIAVFVVLKYVFRVYVLRRRKIYVYGGRR